jgi:hypothetical protein
MAALGGGFIKADSGDLGQVEALHRLADIVVDDAPELTSMMRAYGGLSAARRRSTGRLQTAISARGRYGV